MIEENVVMQLRKEGYKDKTILAICQNEIIGMDRNKVMQALDIRNTSTRGARDYSPKGIDSSYFLG
jgi:hypothetical protein